MMTVALIYGGQGCEREVSISGFRHLFPILDEIFETLPIIIDTNGDWLYKNKRVFPTVGGFYCPESGESLRVDCAFPLLHGDYGEDGVIQCALTVARIPYVGCDGRVGAICRNKSVVKACAEYLGIPTLPHIALRPGDDLSTLTFPLFLKPATLGSSVGASAVREPSELKSALERGFSLCDMMIAEPLLEDKRELECGYFSAKGKELFTNAGEILIDGGFYDYKRKYERRTETRALADIPTEVNEAIRDYSKRLVRYLGIRQISRLDFFLSGEKIYLNEINTMPGFTPDSLYAKMLSGVGIPLKRMLRELCEDCL